ncbi:uncharacterized protein LOC110092139 [Dendrobium catenatum]|uniref:uncharacterized protein LOC110092139 n=1 Tax=Dendrobium catenatum TaxID=906689 RepID=UPI0009F4AE9B|nr:uncharacterized protein LOC110092139 [Dendrobium catenatum]
MANGKPSDLQEYVLRSGVRSGLMREFAFALKSQAELSKSLGRTRSRKGSVEAPASPPSCRRKIPKLSDDREKQPVIIQVPPVGSVILAIPAELPMDVDCSPSGGVAVDIPITDTRNNGHPKGVVGVSISAYSKEELEKDNISSNVPVFSEGIGGGQKDNLQAEKSNANHRKSVSEVKPQNSTRTTTPSRPISLESAAVSSEVSKCPLMNGSVAKQSIVLDGSHDTKISNGLAEKPIRRFTRSALKLMPVAATPPKIEQVEIPGEVKPIRRFTRSTLKSVLPVAATFSSIEQETQGKVIPAVEVPLTVQQEDVMEIPIVVDNCGGLDFETGQLEESIKGEHEGSVSVAIISEFHDDNGTHDVALLEKPTITPTRRFTRSLVSAVEESAVADGSTLISAVSVESEDSKGDNDALNESLRATSKKKMELKMSKKITLTKFPSNVRDLLGTGLLEGLPVKYISCPGKNVGLQGIITGNGVLCSCASCQGKKVVSAYKFEIHAGSTKKHPSDFIFLQNGKSLREVLKSCTGASLDMLEAAIQNAIGPLPPMKLSLCQKCKEFFDTARTGNFALLCNSCLQTSHQQATPTPTKGMSSSTKLPRRVVVHFPSDGTPKNLSSQKRPSYGKLTKKDLGLHKLVFMDDILPQGTEVGYYVRGKKLLEGYIKDSGIFCGCCNSVVSPSQFEAHAGQASRRKPYNNIYTSNGVSLHELSISLSKGRKLAATENDDLCGICADGGDLLLCDLCPRAFHKECIGLSKIPSGDWFCQYCQNLQQKDKCLANNDNAIAAGRVAGVDPIEQIIKRCIRIVSTPENDAGVCALCRQHDFSRSGFDRRTVIICDQCETEYHVGCLKDHDMADLQVLPEGEWFCRPDCSRIHAALHELLRQGPEILEESDANIIKKKLDEKGLSSEATADLKWRLLSNKKDSTDNELLLSQAVSIFQESFDPIVDPISGRDLIPFMVYGRNMRDQDFGGVYCMVLTVKSSVISAGLLRVLGCDIAELPLVATRRENQGLGYFQSLFSCIESMFKSLKVKHFVLPAANDAESMWTNKFGFSKLTPTQLREYAKGTRPIMFQGTSMLHKLLLGPQELPLPADSEPIVCSLPDSS